MVTTFNLTLMQLHSLNCKFQDFIFFTTKKYYTVVLSIFLLSIPSFRDIKGIFPYHVFPPPKSSTTSSYWLGREGAAGVRSAFQQLRKQITQLRSISEGAELNFLGTLKRYFEKTHSYTSATHQGLSSTYSPLPLPVALLLCFPCWLPSNSFLISSF